MIRFILIVLNLEVEKGNILFKNILRPRKAA